MASIVVIVTTAYIVSDSEDSEDSAMKDKAMELQLTKAARRKEIFDFIKMASDFYGAMIVGLILAFSILIAVDTTAYIVSDSVGSEDSEGSAASDQWEASEASDQWEGPRDDEEIGPSVPIPTVNSMFDFYGYECWLDSPTEIVYKTGSPNIVIGITCPVEVQYIFLPAVEPPEEFIQND